jgi:hypothetical protein
MIGAEWQYPRTNYNVRQFFVVALVAWDELVSDEVLGPFTWEEAETVKMWQDAQKSYRHTWFIWQRRDFTPSWRKTLLSRGIDVSVKRGASGDAHHDRATRRTD